MTEPHTGAEPPMEDIQQPILEQLIAVTQNRSLSAAEVMKALFKIWKKNKESFGWKALSFLWMHLGAAYVSETPSPAFTRGSLSELISNTRARLQASSYGEVQPGELCRLITGAVKFERDDNSLLREFASEIEQQFDQFDIRHLVLLLGIVQDLRLAPDYERDLAQRIVNTATPMVGMLGVRGLEGLSRSLRNARGKRIDRLALTDVLSISARPHLRDFEISSVADFIRALGKSGVRNFGALNEACRILLPQLGYLGTEELVKTLKGLARAGCFHGAFLLRAAEELEFRLGRDDDWPEARLASIIRSYATLNTYHVGLFRAVLRRMVPILSQMKPTLMATFLSSYARVGTAEETAFFNEVGAVLRTRVREFTPGAASTCLWALAIVHPRLLWDTLPVVARSFGEKPLYQYTLERLHLASVASATTLPKAIQRQIDSALAEAAKRTDQTISEFERGIGAQLRELGLNPREQVFCNGYFPDWVVKYEGKRIAVDCDGDQYHTVRDLARGQTRNGLRPIGTSALRDLILRKSRYIPVHLRASDWEKSGRSAEFVLQLISEAV